MSSSLEITSNERIECAVTPWYFRRMGLLALMLVGMGAYFLYDGKWGYHKVNEVALKKEWYDTEVIGGYEAAAKEGEEAREKWLEEARNKGWIISSKLNEPRWDDYAAPHGWSAKPKKYSEDEIEQQFYWGGGMFVIAAGVGLLVLRNRNKKFVGEADQMIMPNGAIVPFDSVYKVDKRKWDNKALAYVYYKKDGADKKATVDDLMYAGAGKVLERLLANFKGELIEKVVEPEDDEEDEESTESNPPKA